MQWASGCKAPGTWTCSAKANSSHCPVALWSFHDLAIAFISQNYHFLLTLFHSQKTAVVFLLLPKHDDSRAPWLFCFGHFWASVTLGDHSVETVAFWIMVLFPSLNKHWSFFYLLFQLSFAIWCLVWLHLCLLNDFKRRPSLHMGRRKGLCWFLPYVHLFIYYDFCNLTSIDLFRQSLHSSLETHFFVCSAGSFRENVCCTAHYLQHSSVWLSDGYKINGLGGSSVWIQEAHLIWVILWNETWVLGPSLHL